MPSTSNPENLRRLGDFELLRELGRGGMGIVYEARQVSLNRKVALKVLSGGLGLTSKAVQRFRREAEAAAKLHHTNIVPIYATGEEDGTHFYAMELIDGPSLDQVIRELRDRNRGAGPERGEKPEQPPKAAAELVATIAHGEDSASSSSSTASLTSSSLSSDSHYFDTVARMMAEVADALGYAHKNGVIHRDIKPSNLLLSQEGRLSITDFGLARVLEQPGMTLSGEFVGTPAYMSPEQVAVGRIALDHRTDIYSLGATLYELLTMQRPHQGDSREQVLAQIVQKEPKAPRRIDKRVPVDLETICLKCLEKDPDRRYQTASDLAEDLRRYVNRFAISARRAGPVQRVVKWVRRRPAVAASFGFVVIAVIAVLGFAYQAHRSEQQRLAEREQARKELLNEKTRNAYQIASSGDLKRTEEAIKEIETLGASLGQVRLLRGMVNYFRGDAAACIGDLEQAVKLWPESVTARALLLVAYTDFGQNERSMQLPPLDQYPPMSPEDYVFRGYAREYFDGGTGVGDLNEGVRRRDSPLARTFRAIALSNRAMDTGSQKDAEDALVDANVGRNMLSDNPQARGASLWARTVAASLYLDGRQMEQRAIALQEAAQDIKALEPVIGLPGPITNVWAFYKANGDKEKALDAARRSLKASSTPLAAWFCAVDLYEAGQLDEARKYVESRRQDDLMGDSCGYYFLLRAMVWVAASWSTTRLRTSIRGPALIQLIVIMLRFSWGKRRWLLRS
jgi:serine/threonine protein kinase